MNLAPIDSSVGHQEPRHLHPHSTQEALEAQTADDLAGIVAVQPAWKLPTFENVDVFVGRLIRQGLLVRDPVVEAVLRGHTPNVSIRSLQYRLLQATGLTHKTIQQIERARNAVSLLEQGTLISDTAFGLGYFDQAHLTNSLKRFIGRTPAQIVRKSTVG